MSRSLLERQSDGTYVLRLSREERALLKALPQDLTESLRSEDNDGSTVRLFPPGRSDDLVGQIEYDRLMRDHLEKSHLDALAVLEETAQAETLTEEQLNAWMRALNSLRLVLGTRLDVEQDMTADDIAEDDPNAPAWALYEYLGNLQGYIVETLIDEL